MQRRRIIDITSSTATLGRNQSGSIVRFDRAAGIVITLPAGRAGLWYDFLVKTTATGAHEVRAAGTTDRVGGTLVMAITNSQSKSFLGDGSTHKKVAMNGTTTGGIAGTYFRAFCEGTVWRINGYALSSGTETTPFSA